MTRNASHFKKVDPSITGAESSEEEEEEEEDEDLTSNSDPPGNTNADPAPNLPRRYPVRNCESVRRYGQNIYEQ